MLGDDMTLARCFGCATLRCEGERIQDPFAPVFGVIAETLSAARGRRTIGE